MSECEDGPNCTHTFHVSMTLTHVEQLTDENDNFLKPEDKITMKTDGFSATIQRPAGWLESRINNDDDPNKEAGND